MPKYRLNTVSSTQGQISFKASDLLTKEEFIKHCESRGVFDVSNNFDELLNKDVILPLKGKYPKYLAYEIWRYWDEIPKRNKSVTYELNKEKMLRLRLKWHRRIMTLVYAIQDYNTKLLKALKPTIDDILNDNLSESEKNKNIRSVIREYSKDAVMSIQQLAIKASETHPVIKFFDRGDSSDDYTAFIKVHYIDPLLDDIWRLKGNFDLYTIDRFSLKENLFNTDEVRKAEYESYSPLVRLAQDQWNIVTLLKWFLDDIGGKEVKLELSDLCKFCSKPILQNNIGRPRSFHSKEQDPECYRLRRNHDKSKSRKRLKTA